jgi:hypothetical protein
MLQRSLYFVGRFAPSGYDPQKWYPKKYGIRIQGQQFESGAAV